MNCAPMGLHFCTSQGIPLQSQAISVRHIKNISYRTSNASSLDVCVYPSLVSCVSAFEKHEKICLRTSTTDSTHIALSHTRLTHSSHSSKSRHARMKHTVLSRTETARASPLTSSTRLHCAQVRERPLPAQPAACETHNRLKGTTDTQRATRHVRHTKACSLQVVCASVSAQGVLSQHGPSNHGP